MFSTGNFKNSVGKAVCEELDPTDSCYRATVPVKIGLQVRVEIQCQPVAYF